jgi:hypothetical protein
MVTRYRQSIPILALPRGLARATFMKSRAHRRERSGSTRRSTDVLAHTGLLLTSHRTLAIAPRAWRGSSAIAPKRSASADLISLHTMAQFPPATRRPRPRSSGCTNIPSLPRGRAPSICGTYSARFGPTDLSKWPDPARMPADDDSQALHHHPSQPAPYLNKPSAHRQARQIHAS